MRAKEKIVVEYGKALDERTEERAHAESRGWSDEAGALALAEQKCNLLCWVLHDD